MSLLSIFEKRETVFRKQDRPGWKAAKESLRAAGVRGVRGGDYEVEIPVCGCGARLDPRNFGPKGVIDRRMYIITVPAGEAEAARKILDNLPKE